MYYFQTDFDLTEKTKSLVKQKFAKIWNTNFEHDAEYLILRDIFSIPTIGKELRSFLKVYNLDLQYAGVNTFVSNTKTYTKTNPHIDILHKKTLLPIKSRFNIMILGDPNDPMLWWKSFTFGNPNHTKHKFTYFGNEYESLGVPGNTIEERLKYLGQPDIIKHNLLTPSAFINTFSAHALEISPGPRLILSIPIDKHIHQYCPKSVVNTIPGPTPVSE